MPTADRASSSGTPAANSAPKVEQQDAERDRQAQLLGPLEVVETDVADGVVDRRVADLGDRQVGVRARRPPAVAASTVVDPRRRPRSSAGVAGQRRRRRGRPGSIGRPPSSDRTSSPTDATCGSAVERRCAARRRTARASAGSSCCRLRAWIRTRSVRSAGKPACSTARSARPDSPAPVSPSVSSRVPAAPPPTTATATTDEPAEQRLPAVPGAPAGEPLHGRAPVRRGRRAPVSAGAVQRCGGGHDEPFGSRAIGRHSPSSTAARRRLCGQRPNWGWG